MLQGYYRKGQNARQFTGRALRRHEARAQARTEQRPGRPVIGHMDRAIVAAHNAGLMTAGEYLRGIGFPEAERYASAYGRATAAAYRETHGAEPQDAYAIANGRIRTQYGYTDVAELLAGAKVYKRTAEFLAAEQTAADIRTLVSA